MEDEMAAQCPPAGLPEAELGLAGAGARQGSKWPTSSATQPEKTAFSFQEEANGQVYSVSQLPRPHMFHL